MYKQTYRKHTQTIRVCKSGLRRQTCKKRNNTVYKWTWIDLSHHLPLYICHNWFWVSICEMLRNICYRTVKLFTKLGPAFAGCWVLGKLCVKRRWSFLIRRAREMWSAVILLLDVLVGYTCGWKCSHFHTQLIYVSEYCTVSLMVHFWC